MVCITFNRSQERLATGLDFESSKTIKAISISKDGKDYTSVLEEAIETIDKRDPIIKRIETDLEKQPVSFIKILAANRGVLPDWHIRKVDAWLFVDEVSVK